MSYKKKSWQEKLADKDNFPKVLKLGKKFPCYHAVHKMGVEEGDSIVLANPGEIVEIMKRIPEGRLITIVEICKKIAQRHHVQGCCTLTTGIFIMTAANAVEEAEREGRRLNVPYWRTLKAEGYLNEKYPGGEEAQKILLEKEGIPVTKKGKKYFIQNYQDYLFSL